MCAKIFINQFIVQQETLILNEVDYDTIKIYIGHSYVTLAFLLYSTYLNILKRYSFMNEQGFKQAR